MIQQSSATFSLLCLILFGDGGQAFGPAAVPSRLHQRGQNVVGIMETTTTTTTTSLSLVPGQGIQLVAAFNAASCKDNIGEVVKPSPDHDDNDIKEASTGRKATTATEPPSSSSHWRALAASRSFVARLFHIPCSTIKSHPHPDMELIKSTSSSGSHHNPMFPYNFIPTQQPTPSSSDSSTILFSRDDDDDKIVDTVLYPIVGFRFVTTQEGQTVALPTTCHAACNLPSNTKEDVVGWYNPVCKLDLSSDDICHKPW